MKSPALCWSAGFLFLVCACSSVRAQTHAQALQRNDSEREVFELLNHERTTHGLPELQWDEALFKAAREHALLMLNLNSMEHQLPDEPNLEERLTAAGARFSFVAENIAFGENPQKIHEGWMNSTGHRKNILDARFTAVGIAAVQGDDGLYAVEDFSRAYVKLTPEQQEKQVAALLATKGLHVNGATAEARRSCEGNTGSLGTTSGTVIRFEAGDLSALGPELEKRIAAEPHRNVAVGACNVREGPAGFVRYKIALLFF